MNEIEPQGAPLIEAKISNPNAKFAQQLVLVIVISVFISGIAYSLRNTLFGTDEINTTQSSTEQNTQNNSDNTKAVSVGKNVYINIPSSWSHSGDLGHEKLQEDEDFSAHNYASEQYIIGFVYNDGDLEPTYNSLTSLLEFNKTEYFSTSTELGRDSGFNDNDNRYEEVFYEDNFEGLDVIYRERYTEINKSIVQTQSWTLKSLHDKEKSEFDEILDSLDLRSL